MNCLRQEVTETGSCFTDFFRAVAEHPKEAERWGRLCTLRLLAVHFTPLFNFGYQSIPQGEEEGLTEQVDCETDYIKMLYWLLVYGVIDLQIELTRIVESDWTINIFYPTYISSFRPHNETREWHWGKGSFFDVSICLSVCQKLYLPVVISYATLFWFQPNMNRWCILALWIKKNNTTHSIMLNLHTQL